MSNTVYFAVTVVSHPENNGTETDRFVLVHEKGDRGWWLPGGGVDAGQTIQEAAVREAAEEAGIDIALTGILAVEHGTPREGRLRVIFSAQALSSTSRSGSGLELKSTADHHSRGARWVTVAECLAIDSGDLWCSCSDIPEETCHLRGPEPKHWFRHVAAGGHVAPIEILGTIRLGELPQATVDSLVDSLERAFVPTTFEVRVCASDAEHRVLACCPDVSGRSGELPRYRCPSDSTLNRAAAELARTIGARVMGLLRIDHTLDVRDPSSVFGVSPAGTANMVVTYAADQCEKRQLRVVIDKPGAVGVTFGSAWPTVIRVDAFQLQQVAQPSADVDALCAGCLLVSIDGTDVVQKSFDEAKSLISDRPVTLRFVHRSERDQTAADVTVGGCTSKDLHLARDELQWIEPEDQHTGLLAVATQPTWLLRPEGTAPLASPPVELQVTGLQHFDSDTVSATSEIEPLHYLLDSFDMPIVIAILSLLDNLSFGAAACSCRTFAAAATSEETFEALSKHRWTASLLGYEEVSGTYHGPYDSWKARIMDGNREHALPTLDFRQHGGLAGDWLGFNRDGHTHGRFYRCKVMAVQCYLRRDSDTQTDGVVEVQLHFDAWGERDLRDPLGSTLGLPEHEFQIVPSRCHVTRSRMRASQRAHGYLTFNRPLSTDAPESLATPRPGSLEFAKHWYGRDFPFFFVNSNRRPQQSDYAVVQLASTVQWEVCTKLPQIATDEWTDLPDDKRVQWGAMADSPN